MADGEPMKDYGVAKNAFPGIWKRIKMKYKIHFTLADGSEDVIILEGETIEEIQIKAGEEMKRRGADMNSAWSEETKWNHSGKVTALPALQSGRFI